LEQAQQILDKVIKIESYLYNDIATNRPGVVQRQEDMDTRLEKLETEATVKKKVWAIFGMVGGGLMMLIIELVKWLIHNQK
jgi:hypothetical protein